MKRTFPALASTVLFAVAGLVAATPALADMALATAKNCISCHAVDKKLVGPSFRDVAAKYENQKDAVEKLSLKVIKGGAGVWGPIPMPANTQLSPEDSKKLVAWIMGLK